MKKFKKLYLEYNLEERLDNLGYHSEATSDGIVTAFVRKDNLTNEKYLVSETLTVWDDIDKLLDFCIMQETFSKKMEKD